MLPEMNYKISFQHTVACDIAISGKGLHSGEHANMTISPAPPNHGIAFYREDKDVFIPATTSFISDLNFSTNLQNGEVLVKTVEHLMAAFFILGVDNAIVRIDNIEVPILDGSSRKFIDIIVNTGIKRQNALREYLAVDRNISIRDKEKYISCRPSDTLEIEYIIDFEHRLIKNNRIKTSFSPFYFASDIAPARTFCFLKDIKYLREQGLIKGGNIRNALVFGSKISMNEQRFDDEPIKHKVLDFIGDLYLLGRPVKGSFTIHKGGHSLHTAMAKQLNELFLENSKIDNENQHSLIDEREYTIF